MALEVGVVEVFGAAGSGGGGENSPFWWALWGVFVVAMAGVAFAQRAKRGTTDSNGDTSVGRPTSKLPLWHRALVAAGATAIAVVGFVSGSPGAGRFVVPGLALVFAVLSLIGVTPFGTDNRRSRFWQ